MIAAILLSAALEMGAAAPARLTAEQEMQWREKKRLWSAGQKAWKDGKQEEAIAGMEQVPATADALLGPWHRTTEEALYQLWVWEKARGRTTQAKVYRMRMFRSETKLDPRGHWKRTDAGVLVGTMVRMAGMGAGQLSELAQAYKDDILQEALRDRGRWKEAILVAARLSLSVRKLLGESHPYYATTLNDLALLHSHLGENRAALPLLQKALAIKEQSLGEWHPDYAVSLANLASAHNDMGDRKTALPLHEKALDIWKDANGEQHTHYATCLGNLALLRKEMGDHKAAIALHRKAFLIKKKLFGEQHPDCAVPLINLAILHKTMGDRETALALSQKAMEIIKESLGERHSHYAISLGVLGSLQQEAGNREAALPLLVRAAAIQKDALGERHPNFAAALNNLALLHRDLGDRKAALPFMEQALAIVARQLRDNAASQSDRQQLAAADAVRGYLSNRLLMPDMPGYPTAAEHVLAWKGAGLLRQQQRRLFLRLFSAPASREAAARLWLATRALAALRASPAATKAGLIAMEKEQESAQAKLASLSAAFREQKEKERTTPESLAASLPSGAVLVDYLFYANGLVAFVHRPDKSAVRIDLGKAASVEETLRQWRRLLVAGKPDLGAGERLKSIIYSPLEKYLEGASVVLVSPDGALGTVPFAALPGKKAGTRLIEDVALAVVPAPFAIPDLMKPVPEKEHLPRSLLVVSGVDYDSSGVLLASAGTRSAPLGIQRRWTDLPGTIAEADAVTKAFAARFVVKPVTLSGRAAVKRRVTQVLPKTRYAHLATHGFFAPETVKNALDPSEKQDPSRPAPPTGWHPLLLSGLAFAGANRDPKPGEEDGILTALEVSEMDLTRLELAVLSACETGLGKVAGGEGILGMQRAFTAAGARSVVASLWSVDDKATQQLMTDFYSLAWNAKSATSMAEALRKAQLAMLFRKTLDGKSRGLGRTPEKLSGGDKERLPPYYWAAFVLSGDWR